jgi:hypothetical protein
MVKKKKTAPKKGAAFILETCNQRGHILLGNSHGGAAAAVRGLELDIFVAIIIHTGQGVSINGKLGDTTDQAHGDMCGFHFATLEFFHNCHFLS